MIVSKNIHTISFYGTIALHISLSLLSFFLISNPINASQTDWREVPPSIHGHQWWDTQSLQVNKEGFITIVSKYKPALINTVKNNEVTYLYTMDIDCSKKLFRDTVKDNISISTIKWESTKGDKLIESVIDEACAAS